jgi:hypothetical protein
MDLKNRSKKLENGGNMADLCSYSLNQGYSFLDIVSLVDKAQKRSMSNELDSNDIKKALEYFEYYKPVAERVFVECIGGYSYKGYKFRSHTTVLTLSPAGGTIARKVAEETYTGRGDRFKVHLINRNQTPCSILRFMGSHFIQYDENHIIIGIPGHKPRF